MPTETMHIVLEPKNKQNSLTAVVIYPTLFLYPKVHTETESLKITPCLSLNTVCRNLISSFGSVI